MRFAIPLMLVLVMVTATGCRLMPKETPPVQPAFRNVVPEGAVSEKTLGVLTVLNPDRTMSVGQPLLLEFKLANRSPQDAIVYNELAEGWLVIIEIASTNGSRMSKIRDLSTRPGGKYHYAALPPGGFIGMRYQLALDRAPWGLPPGHYWVRVIYRNPYLHCVASPWITDEDVSAMGAKAAVPLLTGVVVSNVAQFDVME